MDGHRRSEVATVEAEVDLFPVLETLKIDDCCQLTTAPCNFPSIKKLHISRGCYVSLVEKILTDKMTLSSLEVRGGRDA